jgi:hypothetical protein
MAPAVAAYEPRDPSQTVLYNVVADHLETFLASLDADPDATGLPAYVQREFYDYVQCGILAHGFLRLGCDTCHHEVLLAFSCKRRGFCPSCASRRMAQTAAHLVEQIIPWVPTRQWVGSVPIPLRYWMASSQDLTATVHTIICTTIGQYYVNQAVTRGMAASVQQRIACGERAGQKVRRIGSGCSAEGEQPTLSGARCASVHGFSLHANTQVPAHRRDQLARLRRYTAARGAVSLARLQEDANGDLVDTFTHPRSDGTTGIKLSPVELLEKLAALVPLPRGHLVRYGGCLAPHSHRRGAIIPTPRQQGVDEPEASIESPRWGWARLLQRVVALDMARCPWCQRGSLRIIAAITHGEVIRTVLRHLKLAVDPPPMAPARLRQATFAWSSA